MTSNKQMFLLAGFLIATLTFLVPVSTAFAQEKLPSGESVMQRFVEASGGQAAYDKIENRYMKGVLEIVAAGVELNMEAWSAKPNRILVSTKADAIGTITRGSTGKVMWTLSDIQGPVIEEGFAAETQLRDSTFDRLVQWKQLYRSVECVAIEEMDGRKHYKLLLYPRPFDSEDAETEKATVTLWVEKDSSLPAKMEGNIFSSAGTVPITVYMSDYREQDSIKIAFETKMEIMGQTRIMKTLEVKHNLELPASQFDPPEEIQALLKKKDEDQSTDP